jgi:hypothetical protein
MLTATVSGSFHRHMPAVYAAVGELRSLNIDVLSPADPRVVDSIGEFLFVASDRLRSIKLVQDRHFEAIRASDFLWVVCPDGYTGASTCAEIGCAYASRVPVFSDRLPLDITLQHYVKKARSIKDVVAALQSFRQQRNEGPSHVLIDPENSIRSSIRSMEDLNALLMGRSAVAKDRVDVDSAVEIARRDLRRSLGLDQPF